MLTITAGEIWRRLIFFFRSGQFHRDLEEEMEHHVAMKEQGLLDRQGAIPPQEARNAARREFGNKLLLRERSRDVWGLAWLETLIKDVRYGLRMLRRSPGFAAVAIITLALGIGANTAIFSLVDSFVFRPLPLHHPDQIVFLASKWKNGGTGLTFCYSDFLEIRKQATDIFTDTSAMQSFRRDGLSIEGKSQPIWVNYVAGNFFRLLGIKPAFGRLILPSEGKVPGADPVLVLSYSYWSSRFNSDPAVIGEKATINDHPVTIIGVAPEGFHGLSAQMDTQGYMPLGMVAAQGDAPEDFFTSVKDSNISLISRLKPSVSLEQAKAALQVVAHRLPEQLRGLITIDAYSLRPSSFAIDPTNPGALKLVGSLFLILAGALLALACMNIANLFLVRSAMRRHEVALRAALGATRNRLIRQLLTESLVFAAFGCIAGILLGIGASRFLGSVSLHTALPIVLDFRFDWRVFAYAFVVATLAGMLVGITPALRAAHGNLNEVLHEGGGIWARRPQRLRNALVIAEVGGSLMLLIVAGLFVRSLEKARHLNLGFEPAPVLNATLDAHEAGYNEAQTRQFFKTLLDRTRALPGVESASLAVSVPMGYSDYAMALKNIESYQSVPAQKPPWAGFNMISPGYFKTMGIPLLQGRSFRDSDDQNSQYVVIVNQEFVKRYWQGQNPIGRHFSTVDHTTRPMRVVGVVKNSYADGMFDQIQPFYYVPLAQDYNSTVTLQLRSDSTPEALAPEVTGLIHSLEPLMPVFDVQTMTTALETANGFLAFQFAAAIAASLGTLGLVLAVVGVYGVISYAAIQRTHEIGIRLALGAQPKQVLKMILRQGFGLVAVGVVAGIVAAASIARLVHNLLFGVAALDPLTYVSASLLLAIIALAACYLPARRATKVDPMVALRYE